MRPKKALIIGPYIGNDYQANHEGDRCDYSDQRRNRDHDSILDYNRPLDKVKTENDYAAGTKLVPAFVQNLRSLSQTVSRHILNSLQFFCLVNGNVSVILLFKVTTQLDLAGMRSGSCRPFVESNPGSIAVGVFRVAWVHTNVLDSLLNSPSHLGCWERMRFSRSKRPADPRR